MREDSKIVNVGRYDREALNYEKILAEEEKAQREWESHNYSDGFLIADLRRAFELVQKPRWKDPVSCDVSESVLKDVGLSIECVEWGITYFQGCIPKIKKLQFKNGESYYRIKSKGYVC